MPAAVRVGDVTTHGGVVIGPGAPTVLIAGMPAALLGDSHVCALPPVSHQPTMSPFVAGSATVLIAGKPLLRTGDLCACGAAGALGAPAVQVG
jgi:uncharacterized Zn-binding protein involved in type VI secretion